MDFSRENEMIKKYPILSPFSPYVLHNKLWRYVHLGSFKGDSDKQELVHFNERQFTKHWHKFFLQNVSTFVSGSDVFFPVWMSQDVAHALVVNLRVYTGTAECRQRTIYVYTGACWRCITILQTVLNVHCHRCCLKHHECCKVCEVINIQIFHVCQNCCVR